MQTIPEALRGPAKGRPGDEPVVVFEDVHLAFDSNVVLRGITFTLYPGFTKIFLGASGSGKSTVLKLILGLLAPDAGKISVHGVRIDQMREPELFGVRDQTGMVFQEGALFDSLTVGENVGYKLYEESDMPLADVRRRVEEVLGFVELGPYVDRMPSELSGGQRRRVAIARAMAFKPRLLLYDEPTTGLDPMTALTVDAEIIKLRDLEGVTSVLVTHQLRDAFYVATHGATRADGGGTPLVAATREKVEEADFVMLRDGQIVFEGSADELRASTDPYLREFLS
jgi:phospholipid/cholesterol/gamma-HCH transport system ATP-binding protein